jgi:hypothetical protein
MIEFLKRLFAPAKSWHEQYREALEIRDEERRIEFRHYNQKMNRAWDEIYGCRCKRR